MSPRAAQALEFLESPSGDRDRRVATESATEDLVLHGLRTLIYEEHGRIARVQFNREKSTNAFSREMTREVIEVCRRLRADAASEKPRIDALVLTGGTGRSFSVGGDFNDVSRQ